LIFQDGGGRHLGLSNLQFYWLIIVPLQRYCGFFKFSRWQPPPSWIFAIAKFYWFIVGKLSSQFFIFKPIIARRTGHTRQSIFLPATLPSVHRFLTVFTFHYQTCDKYIVKG